MPILQIEHNTANYEGWKKVFDSDPINRKRSGVKRYQIYRMTEDPNYVIIDLYFDNIAETRAALAALQALWPKVQGTVITNHKARIFDIAESMDL